MDAYTLPQAQAAIDAGADDIVIKQQQDAWYIVVSGRPVFGTKSGKPRRYKDLNRAVDAIRVLGACNMRIESDPTNLSDGSRRRSGPRQRTMGV